MNLSGQTTVACYMSTCFLSHSQNREYINANIKCFSHFYCTLALQGDKGDTTTKSGKGKYC